MLILARSTDLIQNKSWMWVLACSLPDESLMSHIMPAFWCAPLSLTVKITMQQLWISPIQQRPGFISLCSYKWLLSAGSPGTCTQCHESNTQTSHKVPWGEASQGTNTKMLQWLRKIGVLGLLSLVTNTPSYLASQMHVASIKVILLKKSK